MVANRFNDQIYILLAVVTANNIFFWLLKRYGQATKNMKATLNPSVVIEILSDSTEYLDKTATTRCYTKIPRLCQIVLVFQKEKHVRSLEREGERWSDTELYEEDDVPYAGDCDVPLGGIYRKVEFAK